MSHKLKGISASNGVAIAKSYILSEPSFDITDSKIENVNSEIEKFNKAVKLTEQQLQNIYEITKTKLDESKAEIFLAHIQLAQDPEINNDIIHEITENKNNVVFSVETIFNKYWNVFNNMEDKYFKERANDVLDIKKRILANLLNVQLPDITLIKDEVIIVANDLTPSQTALLDKKYVKGFITKIGGKTSHAAIIARSMEIPAILGVDNILQVVSKNNILIGMDGSSGEIEVEVENIKKWDTLKNNFLKEQEELKKFIDFKTSTLDKIHVDVEANIGKPSDASMALKYGCEGVGLYRSEFLYMDNDHWPTEEEQFIGYKSVLESMGNKLVVIRTLDIGGDKHLSYFEFPKEMNPFLGYRAIRFCLRNKEIFRTQLRALGRASIYGNLGIMFPMIATIDEFKQAKQFTLDCFDELKKEGHKISNKIQIGMMVEIPSSAVLANQFGKYADFFSIGTNDLIQYTFACDRMSQNINYLYQPNNPSLLNLIKLTVDGAHKNKKWCGMCGEMAGDIKSIPLLLGIGIDAFSMSAASIPKAKMLISKISKKECKILANKALKLQTIDEVNQLVGNFIEKKVK